MPAASPDDPLVLRARDRLREEGAVDRFLPLFLFEAGGPLRDALHLLKYSGLPALGDALGAELGRHVAGDPDFAAADLLVPVPLHPARLRERGFNQSERIARGAAAAAGIPARADLVRRSRNTPTQTSLGFRDRETNVRGAFGAGRGASAAAGGRTIILVDDVVTTGATLRACALVLRASGAERVFAASVALADDPDC